jgi:type IV secretory pathway TrbF-like protein
MIKKLICFTVVTLLAIATPIRSQQLMNFLTRTTIPVVIQCPGCNKYTKNKPSGSTAKTTLKTLSTAVPSAVFSKQLIFVPSIVIHRRNLAKFVATTRTVDPEGAVKMEQLFASTNVMDQIDKAMMKVGLKSNNVADAYAVYWTNAWLGARGRNEDLPKAQMIAVRNQAANALLAAPPFKLATDAQKQEMTEAMLIQSALISASIDSAKSDPILMEKVKAAIAQGAKGMGLDLDRMTLTPKGFSPVN